MKIRSVAKDSPRPEAKYVIYTQALYGFCKLNWERGSRMAETTIVSRYLHWVRGSRVAEATIVSRYHPGVRGDPRGRSHYREPPSPT